MTRGLWVGSALLLTGCILAGGCSNQAAVRVPSSPFKAKALPRHGAVTKEMILLDGGFCGESDVCFDQKSQQNFDCDVEFSCVPTTLPP